MAADAAPADTAGIEDVEDHELPTKADAAATDLLQQGVDQLQFGSGHHGHLVDEDHRRLF